MKSVLVTWLIVFFAGFLWLSWELLSWRFAGACLLLVAAVLTAEMLYEESDTWYIDEEDYQ